MKFILLIFLAALSLESIGTYVSVFGLSKTFSGDPVIIAMAIVLDFVKIVVVSLLYKYWDRLGNLLKYLFLPAALVTMIITSYGVAGYMSSAFQGAIQETAQIDVQLENYERERDKLEVRKKEMDTQISALPDDYVRARQRLMNSFAEELKPLNARINALDKQILELKQSNITATHDLGPIAFLSSAFGIQVSTAVGILIGLVVFVFDPLAVLLLIAGNMLLVDREKERESIHKEELALEKEKVVLKKAKIDHEIEEIAHSAVGIDPPSSPEPIPPRNVEVKEHSVAEAPVVFPKMKPQLYTIQEPKEVYVERKVVAPFIQQEHHRPEISGKWISATALPSQVKENPKLNVDITSTEYESSPSILLHSAQTPHTEELRPISPTANTEVLVPIEQVVEETSPPLPIWETIPTLTDYFPEYAEEVSIEEPVVEESVEATPIDVPRETVVLEDKGHAYAKWTAAVHNPSMFTTTPTATVEPEPTINSIAELEVYLSDLNDKGVLTTEEIKDKEKIEKYLRKKDADRGVDKDDTFIKKNPYGIDVR